MPEAPPPERPAGHQQHHPLFSSGSLAFLVPRRCHVYSVDLGRAVGGVDDVADVAVISDVADITSVADVTDVADVRPVVREAEPRALDGGAVCHPGSGF